MSIDLFLTLFGGLGLFLFGMRIMGDALEHAAGPKLKNFLSAMTRNKFIAMLTGLCVTAIIQSSGATTVMVVGFVNAQLLTLAQSVGVIMGANIGTTVTSLLLSVKFDPGPVFSMLGMLMILIFDKRDTLRQTGTVFMGLGILFIGMNLMSDAMMPLRDLPVFVEMMKGVSSPFVGVLIGAAITALLQSSSVSVGILQALAMSGLVSMQGAMYILLGANIGSCLPSLLAMANTSLNAKRTALIHLLFNVVGTVLFLLLSSFLPIASWAESLIPNNPKLCIACMHISFNIVSTLILLPCSNLMVKLSSLIIRGNETSTNTELKMQFFDERLLKTPSIAAEQLYLETCRMGRNSREHFVMAVNALLHADLTNEKELEDHEELADYLEEHITEGLVNVMPLELSEHESRRIGNMFHVVNDLERISDHADNLLNLTRERVQRNVKFTEKAIEELSELYSHTIKVLDVSMEGLEEWQMTEGVLALMENEENRVDDITETLRSKHIERLKVKKCSPKSGVVFLEVINNLERVADHATNIAACAMEACAVHTHYTSDMK